MRCSMPFDWRHAPARLCAAFPLLLSVGVSAQTSNRPPSIAGTPPTWGYVGAPYSFAPTASDPERATLRFSVANKPAWASFSTSSGRLSGTPQAVGLWDNIKISVSDGKTTVALPAFSLRATSKANKPPTISGTPASSVTIGAGYSFQPVGKDPNGDPLRYSITNKPAWATFNAVSGVLSGTPTSAHAGAYSNIVIRASDGSAHAALPSFTITVLGASSNGATLSWSAPTRNIDGTVLANLAGYRIHYGASRTMLTHTIEVPNPGITTYVLDELASGTYYFAVRAYSSNGMQSTASNIVTHVVR
jgi:Putative Ig domain